ncbi:MAG: multidrug transporter, partial [Firmicutes bacterium]|nr:multidrug transporter [Bacillota bacterium]
MRLLFKQAYQSFKNINFKLCLCLLLMGFIPTIYQTIRIFLLGQIADDSSFSIASQMQWVEVIYEVVQEAAILPLFFFIGKAFKESGSKLFKDSQIANMIRTGLIIVFCVFAVISLILIIFANPLVQLMAQDYSILQQTATYIRLETLAKLVDLLVKFVVIVLVVLKKEKYLYIILTLQMVLSILFDLFLLSNLPISAKIGVNGIAISNIIVNLTLFIVSIIILHKESLTIFQKTKLSFKWINGWIKIGAISGIESLIRNILFIFIVVRMVNIVGEQGTFWLANNFIWGWLLLPILQLGELIKRDCGENKNAIQQNLLGYFALTTVFLIFWFVSIPLWKLFLRDVLQLNSYEDIFFICIISIPFYIIFAFNNVIDSIFYGIGKTKYMLYQTIITNIVWYGGV